MILTDHKIAFIHLQKTGGTSILGCFIDAPDLMEHEVDSFVAWRERSAGMLDSAGIVLPGVSLHRSLAQTKRDIEEIGGDPRGWKFFTIVRNPWALLRSAHRYMIKRGHLMADAPFDPLAHSGIINAMQRTADDRDRFDRVLRFECLRHDWAELCDEWGIEPPRALGFHNITLPAATALQFPSGARHDMLLGLLSDYCRDFGYPKRPGDINADNLQ